jgi:NADPH2:quinone reductase
MKAIVIHEYGPAEALKYETLPDPEPRAGEVRVQVRAATVNRMLDVAMRRGEQLHRNIRLPVIPGVDCAGVIDKLGLGVSRWKVGDRVAAAGTMPLDPCSEDRSSYRGPVGMMGIHRPGGFADMVVLPACVLDPLPANISFHDAAIATRHCPTAWNLLVNIAQLKPGEWALIMGASGNLGRMGIQIAKNVIGARVICAAGTRERVEIGMELGADYGVNYVSEDICDRVMTITGGWGVDVLYDNIANPKVLPRAFLSIGKGGRLVTAGAHAGPVVPIDFFHLYDHRITIRGMPGYNAADRPSCFEAVASGKIKITVDRILPLSQARTAHLLMEGDIGVGKIVLDPTLDRP